MPVTDPTQQLKVRARRRLIGALILVLTAIVVLPMLLDSKPRAVNPNVPIDIPDKNTPFTPKLDKPVVPLSTAPVTPASASITASIATPSPVASAAALTTPVVATPKIETPADVLPEPKTQVAAKPEIKIETQSIAKSETQTQTQTKTQTHTTPSKFVIQVAAYSDDVKAQQWVKKLKAAGIKAYTEKVQTSSGIRIRVRAGPYTSQIQANQALEKIKALGASEARITPAS